MVGIDITKISRFKNPKKSFIKKILHPEEINEYQESKNKPKFLAKRWAIKEAIFKCENKLFHFDKIKLTEKDRVMSYKGYKISTSSEDDYYIAIAIKE